MSKKGLELGISDTDLRHSLASIKKNGGDLLEKCKHEVNKATMNAAADTQQNLKDNGSVATGRLINSITNKFNALTGVGVVTVNAAYAYYVEFGRKAGGMPPIAPILTWVRKKGLAETTSKGKDGKRRKDKRDDQQKEAEIQIATAIAKSIAKNGTQAHPFLIPAWKANSKKLVTALKRTIKINTRNMKPK